MKIAVLQLDVKPAPTMDRLERASHLVKGATRAGAQLIVLPELFNTGYTYSPENFHRAETVDGPTLSWMIANAKQLGVHLGGTLLLREGGEIYNAFLLVAPDGRTWRYDKIFPWAYEHAYFRGGDRLTIAETTIGRIGMLVCWDAAHPELWRNFAGKVDLVLLANCPPRVDEAVYRLPDGKVFTNEALGPVMRSLRGTVQEVFSRGVAEQAAWLGVPVISSTACGMFHSHLPNARAVLRLMLPFVPWLRRYLPLADQIEMTCPVFPAGKVLNAEGQQLAALTSELGEAYCLVEVSLSEHPPQPEGSQPGKPVSWLTYGLADWIVPSLCKGIYKSYGSFHG